jgi:hypothetical protein
MCDTNPFLKKLIVFLKNSPTQRMFAFKLKYSTTTTKNKETLHFFDQFIYSLLVTVSLFVLF